MRWAHALLTTYYCADLEIQRHPQDLAAHGDVLGQHQLRAWIAVWVWVWGGKAAAVGVLVAAAVQSVAQGSCKQCQRGALVRGFELRLRPRPKGRRGALLPSTHLVHGRREDQSDPVAETLAHIGVQQEYRKRGDYEAHRRQQHRHPVVDVRVPLEHDGVRHDREGLAAVGVVGECVDPRARGLNKVL